MRLQSLLATAALFAIGTDAYPSNGSVAKRNLMHFRRDQLLGGKDHSLMRREGVKDRYEFFCEKKNRNSFQWNKVGMGPQLKLESNLFYDEGPCGVGPYGSFDNYKNFPDAIHGQIQGYGGWNGCTVEDCDVSFLDDLCKEDDDNTMWLFFLESISNYALYVERLAERIEFGFTNASNAVSGVVNDFSEHAKNEVNPALPALIIISSFFGGIAGGIGLLSPVGGAIAGAVSGIAGIGVGIINTAGGNQPAVEVQQQLDREAALKKYIDSVSTTVLNAVHHWGRDLIEGKVNPVNDPYQQKWYSAQEYSLPAVLSNGDFAENRRDEITPVLSDVMTTYFKMGAFTYVWMQEMVFIVKLSRKVGGQAACDIDLGEVKIGKDKTYCKDGTLYFFHKAKEKPTGLSFHLESPSGMDKLEESLGVTKERLIDAAVAAQNDAGYLKEWTTEEAILAASKGGVVEFFNIPVCDLDSLWDQTQEKFDPLWRRVYERIILCSTQKDKNGKKFPYKYKTWYYP